MRTVRINAAKPYDVIIGTGLLGRTGEYITALGGTEKVMLVTDDNVGPLYSGIVRASLESAGFTVNEYVIEHGERSKNAHNYIALLECMASAGMTRGDMVIALGGGVVGDLAGFAASSYMRGIRVVQLPTTVLSAVDSSVGGKTAIDLEAGKNLAGAFHSPSLVLCDYSVFETLPPEIFADGCAEIIKHAIIADRDLFAHLMENGKDFDVEYVLERNVQIKGDVVARDEFEHGERQKLNFGHTAAHAIEKCSGYAVSHGSAVASGSCIIARAAANCGVCSEKCADEICGMFERFGLPVGTEYSIEQLSEVMLSDKKHRNGATTVVLPECIGKCLLRKVPDSELAEFFAGGIR